MNKSYYYSILFLFYGWLVIYPYLSPAQTINVAAVTLDNYAYEYPTYYADFNQYQLLVNTDATAAIAYYQQIPTQTATEKIKRQLYQGLHYHHQGQYDSLAVVLDSIKTQYDTLAQPFVHYIWSKLRTQNHFNLGNYARALAIAEQTANLPIVQQTPEFAAEVKVQMGYARAFSSHLADAIEDFSWALKIAEVGKDSMLLAKLWNGLGVTYADLGEQETAVVYFQQALAYTQRHRLFLSISIINNLAVVHERMNKWEASYQYLLLSLKIRNEYDYRHGLFMQMNNLGYYHLHTGSLDSAEYYVQRALQLANKQKNQKRIAFINFTHASILLKKGDWQQAKRLGEDMIATAYGTNNHLVRIRGYWILAAAAEMSKDWQTASNFYKKHYILKDSVSQVNNTEKVKQLEDHFILQRKDAEINYLSEINLLQKEKLAANQKQGYLLITLLIISIIAALFAINYFRQRNRVLRQKQQLQQEEHRNLTLSAQVAEAERALEIEKRQQLEENITQRNRELAVNALSLTTKNDVLDKLLQMLHKVDKDNWKTVVRELESSIRTNLDADRDWEVIKVHFERVYPQFFAALRAQHPELSQNNIRHIVYLKMEMSAKEVARMLNINPSSVDMVRYRLKKKLNLCRDTKLIDYLYQLEQEAVVI